MLLLIRVYLLDFFTHALRALGMGAGVGIYRSSMENIYRENPLRRERGGFVYFGGAFPDHKHTKNSIFTGVLTTTKKSTQGQRTGERIWLRNGKGMEGEKPIYY